MNKGVFFVSDGKLQVTLREWRHQMARPKRLVALAGIGAILGVAGPFGTEDSLWLGPRLLYWVVIVYTTYATGALVAAVIDPWLAAWPRIGQILGFGLINGLAVWAVVMAINLMAFRPHIDLAAMLDLLGGVMVISVIISAVTSILNTPADPAPAGTPPILDRLPFEKRGALVALSVEDHYVRVQTVKGEEMILMRLSDAMREVGETAGAQVHRSHWAAFQAVAGARREGERAILTMTTGAEIPVSRANLPKIRAAGLLPK